MAMGPKSDIGVWFGMLSDKEKQTVITEVGREAAEMFSIKKSAIREAVGLKDLRGADRLEAYNNRESEIWAAIERFNPEEYQRQMRDWNQLQKRVAFSSPAQARPITGGGGPQGEVAGAQPAAMPGGFM